MDSTDVAIVQSAPPASVADTYERLFAPLVEKAVDQLEWLMLNSDDEKMVMNTAQDILDRAGASKKPEQTLAPVIEIRDSEVKLLVEAAKETVRDYSQHDRREGGD